ncbi:MAG: hypothetical protein QN720_09105 [Nitrososphaeraceae archaeon]|nr:hypothetical protein [Nitrososphaeraceae archaeon]MDW0333127.1 hypothetical protein [Nitrososphaeraceae archaeon]
MTVWGKKLQPVSGQIPAKPIRYIRSGKVRIIVEDESTIELRAEDDRVILNLLSPIS